MRISSLLVIIVLSCVATMAHAADPMAEALFEEGKTLLEQERYDEACEKLKASQAREPKSGTLINLAFCHEKQGKTATAWAEYRAAIALGNDEGRSDFADNAEQFAAAIEPTLARLTLVVPRSQAAIVTVELDGSPLDPGSFRSAFPVDPGSHQLRATAEGHQPWTGTVEVASFDNQRVVIPELIALAPPEPEPVVAPPPEPTTPPAPVPPPDASEGGIPTWTWIVGGVGVASLIASGAFLASQLSAGSTLDDACGAERVACPSSYDFSDDRSREKRDNILFITFGAVGIVAVGAAAVGMIVGSPEPATAWRVQPWVGTDGVGLAIAGVLDWAPVHP